MTDEWGRYCSEYALSCIHFCEIFYQVPLNCCSYGRHWCRPEPGQHFLTPTERICTGQTSRTPQQRTARRQAFIFESLLSLQICITYICAGAWIGIVEKDWRQSITWDIIINRYICDIFLTHRKVVPIQSSSGVIPKSLSKRVLLFVRKCVRGHRSAAANRANQCSPVTFYAQKQYIWRCNAQFG